MRITVKPEVQKQCNDWRTDQTAFFWRLSSHISLETQKGELYDEKLKDVLEMLDLEWSKDDKIKTQCNWLDKSPLHRGNASK